VALSRRQFSKELIGLAGAALAIGETPLHAKEMPSQTEGMPSVNFIVPRDYIPPANKTKNPHYSGALCRAALDFLEQNYKGKSVPVWYRKYETIDFEIRIQNIIYWIMKGVALHQKIYPVDPAWILAQIMQESFFCEFTVSKALAVGVCQFVNATASEYGMLSAGDRAVHASSKYKKSEFAGAIKEYHQLRRNRRRFLRKNRSSLKVKPEDLMQSIFEGNQSEALLVKAKKYVALKRQSAEFDQKIDNARDNYRSFLLENLKGRDIFNKNDLDFIVQFDERLTYKKPVLSMIKMIARALRARNGNIVTAAAGYNAGLSTTIAQGVFKPYGTLPNYNETATYISRVLVFYHELNRRMVSR